MEPMEPMEPMEKRDSSPDRPYIRDEDYMPYPELLGEGSGPYEIIDSRDTPGMPTNGMTDKMERVMWVPLDEAGTQVSRHEMAHVKWSPERVDPKALRIAAMFVRAVEDARVNLGLVHCGLDLAFDDGLSSEVLSIARRDLAHGDIVTFTLRAVASSGTNLEGPVAALVSGDEEPIYATVRWLIAEAYRRLERSRRLGGSVVATFERGADVARWLADEFRKRGFRIPTESGGVLAACCSGIHDESAHRRGRRGMGVRPRGSLADGVRPGRMRIATPPLPHRCENAPSAARRRKRAVAEGVDIRYFHRFVEGQRVFARTIRRKPERGGAVLIDVSGSMCLGTADIERIIADTPAGTVVAIYSGRADTGELRIVARDGYRASARDLAPYGSSNVVDLPALKWLAKQPGPRLWISDGLVTGSADVATRALTTRCREICKEASIVCVADVAAAAEALATARAGVAAAAKASRPADPATLFTRRGSAS
jgi:hypothetical protein